MAGSSRSATGRVSGPVPVTAAETPDWWSVGSGCRNSRDSFKVWVCYDSSPLIVVPKTRVVHRITLFCAVVSLEHGWVGVPGVGDGDRDAVFPRRLLLGKPDLIDRPAAGKAAVGDEIGDGKKSWRA